VIRELGFANICMGIIAMTSLIQAEWRLPAAVAGGLYFGLAGLLHVFKKPDSRNEMIALVADLYLFIVMAAYIVLRIR
jgi:hypothetical protein